MKMEVIIFRTINTLMVLERFVPVTIKDLGNSLLANINKSPK